MCERENCREREPLKNGEGVGEEVRNHVELNDTSGPHQQSGFNAHQHGVNATERVAASSGVNEDVEVNNRPWETINRKKQRNGIPPSITFVGNLPDGCCRTVILNSFREFGNIVHVYVAKKKDKLGNNFGFVTFLGIQDVKAMEANLKEVKISNLVLDVHIALYKRNGEPQVIAPSSNHKESSISSNPPLKSLHPRPHGMSFKDILMKQHQTCGPDVKEKTITIGLDEELPMSEHYNGSLIARALNMDILCQIHNLACSECSLDLNIKYLGGLFLLLSFPNQTEAEKFLHNKQVWVSWFSKVEAWRGQSLPYERIAWLRIHGVPAHLWNPVVFDKIGEAFGRLIRPSKACWVDGNFSYECVGVLVNNGNTISDNFVLKWSSKSFRGWVNESPVDWSPPYTVPDPTPVSRSTKTQSVSPVCSPENFGGNNFTSPIVGKRDSIRTGATVTVGVGDLPAKGHQPLNATLNANLNLESECTVHDGVGLTSQTNQDFVGHVSEPSSTQGDLEFGFSLGNKSASNKRSRKPRKLKVGPQISPLSHSGLGSQSESPDLELAHKPKKRNRTEDPPFDPLSLQPQPSPSSIFMLSPPVAHCNLVFSTELPVSEQRCVHAAIAHPALLSQPSPAPFIPVTSLQYETTATKQVAELFGINLQGFESVIEEAIIGDGLSLVDK